MVNVLLIVSQEVTVVSNTSKLKAYRFLNIAIKEHFFTHAKLRLNY